MFPAIPGYMYSGFTLHKAGLHRVITVIERQRLAVLGSGALFTKVGQLRRHMKEKRGGNISYLYRQKKGRVTRALGRI